MCLRFYMHTTVVWIVSVRIVSAMWRGRMFYAQLAYFGFLDAVDFYLYILRVYTQMLHRWWYNTRLTRLVKSESVTLHSVGNGITTTMQQQQGLPQPPSGWRAEILCREQSISTEATPCFDNLTTQQREGSTFSWEFLKFQQLGGFWGSMQVHGSELLRGRVVHLYHSVTPTSVLWPGRATSWCSTLPPYS